MAAAGFALAAGLVSTAIGAKAGAKSADQQKDAQQKNAELTLAEMAEDVRRTTRANRRQMAAAKAASYSSGIRMGAGVVGMNDAYLEDMQAEFQRELDWTQKSGKSSAEAQRKGANAQYKAAMYQNTANTLRNTTALLSQWWGNA